MKTNEIKELIRDYQSYKARAESFINNRPYHAFLDHLKKTITMCDNKIKELEDLLKKNEENI